MSLLQQAPRFALADAERLARDLYGLAAAAASLPSERDQNFVLTAATGARFVLKVANAAEDRAMLEAQNAAMAHVAGRVALCPRVLPTVAGETIGVAPGGSHFVRLVTYLAGVPLAEVGDRTPALFESLGRAVGRLDAALADFDHPAIHRRFHWDLANAASIIREHLPLMREDAHRELVDRVSTAALNAIGPRVSAFRRSAIHNDANDWNVLVSNPDRGRIQYPTPMDGSGGSDTVSDPRRLSTPEVVGIIDFGDMVHSWTVADPAVAVAYAVLDSTDPLATADAIAGGYQVEHPLREEELAAVFPLACLRLCLSASIAAWQQRQRPDDDYLAVSQEPIRRTLPALADLLDRRTEGNA